MAEPLLHEARGLRVAIAGNPNAGKSSIFNCLTGLRQKVGNYPGVTVERKIGHARFGGVDFELIDLPGAYSLTVQSPDEEVSRDVLFGWLTEAEPAPDVVVVVIDATNLQRNLFLATQIAELGYPCVGVLNMSDLAASHGLVIDPAELGRQLGIPMVATVGSRGTGIDTLRATLLEPVSEAREVPLPPAAESEVNALAEVLATQFATARRLARSIALRLIVSPDGEDLAARKFGPPMREMVALARRRMTDAGVPWQSVEATARYAWLREVVAAATQQPTEPPRSRSEQLDRVLTHRVWGPVVFFGLMALVFQSIYTWATPLMDLIDAGTVWLGDLVRGLLAPGMLTDLLVDGVIAGVGGVVIFLPQILLLFLFIAILEDTGYMARAAFVMDRLMSKVGLHGRSFVPLLSSFACAIPGIMAARTIGNKRDRLTTILVAPLITCPARLPVYALLIAAFVPQKRVWGPLTAQGLTLLALYLLGVFGALAIAALLKRTILRGPTPSLVLELPSYRLPVAKHLVRDLYERAILFLRFAGSVILACSILLWVLAYFPRADLSAAPSLAVQRVLEAGGDPTDPDQLAVAQGQVEGQLQLEQSYIGRLGHGLEPAVRPLGFDWRIGIGLITSFAAREVMVSTMGVIFAVGDEATEEDATLKDRLRQATRPDGTRLFTLPVVGSLLVFFVYAMQCMSTLGVAVRETGGWRWPAFMVTYMTLLAYGAALVTYHGMRALGL